MILIISLEVIAFIFLSLPGDIYVHCEAAPKIPPQHLTNGYTMNDSIPIEYFYVDDTVDGQGSHYIYNSQQIKKMITSAGKFFDKLGTIVEDMKAKSLPSSMILGKLKKEDWLYYALLNYTKELSKSQVVVTGSTNPWVESIALALGASHVTTLEYNKLTYGDSSEGLNLSTVSGNNFEEFYNSFNGTYDIAFSMSSFDHDGLGRYGDPLNPDGDLKAMQRVSDLLKPGGLLFLSVPVGPDVVVFNLHRRYGPVRLPALLSGWDIVEKIGWIEERLTQSANWRQTYEPIFILRKPVDLVPIESVCVL